jgi:hypothetical protein
MTHLADRHAAALERFLEGVPDVDWALTGSTSFALQSVPVEPDDVDVQTDGAGVRAIEESFSDAVAESIEYGDSDRMRSYLGALELEAVEVELVGELRKRDADGGWDKPVDVIDHREYIDWRDYEVPVLSLEYEATAYERLGREERAALLREHADG